MDLNLILATHQGVVICAPQEGDWREVARGLEGQHVTSVIAREGVILAGTTRGVYRSYDGGLSWVEAAVGLSLPHVRWLAYHPDVSDFELAGTEPAGIFVSKDGGSSWRSCPEVEQLRDRLGWSLPYSPEAGCVRGFAFHGQRAYAAVEVGGVLVSDDGGETWRLAEGSRGRTGAGPVHPDVHSIQVHPSSPDLVFAPTGGGFYRSADGGQTWEHLYSGIYCRAAWIDPADPDHILLGPANGVDSLGRIEETRDGGRTWSLASDGLSVPWPGHMVERFFQVGDQLLAILSNGELLAAPLAGLVWRQVLPAGQWVAAAAAAEVI